MRPIRWPSVPFLVLSLSCTGSNGVSDTGPADTPPAEVPALDAPPADVVPVKRDDKGFEVDPPGAWYAGDLHVHASGASKGTNNESFPPDIAKTARERGLSFVVLTDHSYADRTNPDAEEDPAKYNQGPEFPYWDLAASLSEPGAFLMVDGSEICPIAAGALPSEPRGHIGCIPKDLATFDRTGAFVDRPPGEVTGGQALAQAKARGCFAVIDHPYDMLVAIAYDWTGAGYDAMELWYGTLGYDPSDQAAYDAWRCDLLAGRKIVGVGGAACHRLPIAPPGELLDPALGFPRTSVFATELAWPAIVEGLRAGRVSVHDGRSLLRIDGYDADRLRTEGGSTRWIRLRGGLDPAGDDAVLTLRRAFACKDPRPAADPPAVTEEILHTIDVKPGSSFDETVAVAGAPGVYTAMLITGSGHYGALSTAIVIPED
jgi:hypothetical protein